jgi:hypothetical protein
MATNPPAGDGHRNGAVKDRSQVYNPQNDRWTKRDAETGQFMDQMAKPRKAVQGHSQREVVSAAAECRLTTDAQVGGTAGGPV